MSKLFCQPCAVANSPLRIDYVPICDVLLNVGFSILLGISRHCVSHVSSRPWSVSRLLWVQFDKPTATAVSEWVCPKMGHPLAPLNPMVWCRNSFPEHMAISWTVVVNPNSTDVTRCDEVEEKRKLEEKRPQGFWTFEHLQIGSKDALYKNGGFSLVSSSIWRFSQEIYGNLRFQTMGIGVVVLDIKRGSIVWA